MGSGFRNMEGTMDLVGGLGESCDFDEVGNEVYLVFR